MSLPISAVSLPPAVQPTDLKVTSADGGEFRNILTSAIQQVESSRASANNAVQSFLTGENQELHSTILATQKAELQFDMFIQVRNKVVSAYQEIMRMQI